MDFLRFIVYMCREFIFDSKDEYDFKSSKFNVRKFLVFIAFTASVIVNFIMMGRVVTIARENVKVRSELVAMKEDIQIAFRTYCNDKEYPSEVITNDRLDNAELKKIARTAAESRKSTTEAVKKPLDRSSDSEER